MTIIEAVKQVMGEAGRAMTPQEAYDAIIAQGLYRFRAKRPVDIVRGEIRSHCREIDFPSASPTKHFTLSKDGRFRPLTSPMKAAVRKRQRRKTAKASQARRRASSQILQELRRLHNEHRDAVKTELLSDLRRLDSASFEGFSRCLIDAYGFIDTRVTPAGRDGGIDGSGKLKVGLTYLNVAFQCKRWRGAVGRPEIDRFRGAIQGQFEQGIFFSTSPFAAGAESASFRAGAVPIILIDGAAIVELMIDRGFGVQTESLPVHSNALDLVLAAEVETPED